MGNIRFRSKGRKKHTHTHTHTHTRQRYTQPLPFSELERRCGSKNRKTKSLSFSTRAVYSSQLELAEIYGSGQKTGNALVRLGRKFLVRLCAEYTDRVKKRKIACSGFLTRTVYFSELDCRNIWLVHAFIKSTLALFFFYVSVATATLDKWTVG